MKTYGEKACPECKGTFTKTAHNQVYCSHKCRGAATREARLERMREYNAARYAADPEKYKAKVKAYVAANRDVVNERGRAARERDKDAINAARRANNNKPKLAAQKRAYVAANPEKVKEWKRNFYLRDRDAEGFAYVLVSSYRPGVVKIGTSKNLVSRLQTARCFLSDAEYVRSYPGGMQVEYYLHSVFKDRREDGEWFAVGPRSVDCAIQVLEDVKRVVSCE